VKQEVVVAAAHAARQQEERVRPVHRRHGTALIEHVFTVKRGLLKLYFDPATIRPLAVHR
jgi:hypothetical protein